MRIWLIHRDSPVRITVTPDKPVTTHEGGPTDEGYYNRWERYFINDEGVLLCQIETSSRDCDGRLDSSNLLAWDGKTTRPLWVDQGQWIDGEGFADVYDHSIQLPDWDRIHSRQRDYSAAAMGY
jgi:hypothetical protein